MAQTTKHHASHVQAAVARGSAATSAVAASWRRSSSFHRLDPTERSLPRRLTQGEFNQAKQQIEPLVRAAQSNLDRLFLAVGGVGCCVLLADHNGVSVDRRGAVSDDATFQTWGLWTGTVWSEDCEGTNGIGTCLAEQRALTIHRDQHFYARNALLSCTSAPIYDHEGKLAAALDVSSCRADLTEGFVNLISVAVTDAARRIEVEYFRLAFPNARFLFVPDVNRGGGGLIAVDADDLVIGATRAARLALGVARDFLTRPLPATDLLGGTAGAMEDLGRAERRRTAGVGANGRECFRRRRSTRDQPRNAAPKAAAAGPPPRALIFFGSTVAVLRHARPQSGFSGLTKKPLFGMVFSKRRIRRRHWERAMNKVEFSRTAKAPFEKRYGNYINGKWAEPRSGKYFENFSPVNGRLLCEIARSNAQDIEDALDAAHAAKEAWGRTSVAERALILNRIADRMEENLGLLALAETWDNGKPIRETTAADVPLAIDHFRYFASAIRAQEGGLSEIDHDTVAYHFHEPLGVVGQIIPWNFPLLMACWKLAPAIAAGNCVVLKPAEQTPAAIMVWAGLIGDLLPPGVLNIVNGFGLEAGKPLASSPRIAKIAFTGETSTGRLIMQYASQNLIPVTLELGGKSPNIFFNDVMAEDDDFLDKAIEGFVMFAFNQGEVCTCPSRALIHESIFDRFMERALKRVEAIVQGDPLDPATMIGAQASSEQFEKILSYIDIGREEGAQVLTGGTRNLLPGDLSGGFYVKPTVFKGNNKMRIFQEEIFGPVVSVTTFKDDEEALSIANDTLYGLGAGIWSRDANRLYRFGRAIQAGRVWTNCYHAYPAHAAFGGYKQSGVGRETHKMMLDHYQQTKNLLVSYSPKKLGFF